MSHRARTAPRLLTAAVAVALAVTAGAASTPALAAAPAAVTAPTDAPASVPLIEHGGRLAASGATGFLTLTSLDDTRATTWTRYADGATTTLPRNTTVLPSGRTDLVTQVDSRVLTIRDMTGGGEPVVMRLDDLDSGYQTGRAVSQTSAVAVRGDSGGGEHLHLVTRTATGLRAESITGLPQGANITSIAVDSPTTVLVRYAAPAASGTSRLAVVDVERRTVVEDVAPAHQADSVAVSPTHLAWVETPTASTATVVVMARGKTPAEALRIPLQKAEGLRVSLLDGWVLYGREGADTASTPNPLHALTARSLTEPTTVKVLDTFTRGTPRPDGTVLAQGGTVDHGEGVYQVGVDPVSGVPKATQVARTGRPTALTLLSSNVPAVVDFDKPSPVILSWRLSATVRPTVTLTHVATGETVRGTDLYSDRGLAEFTWNGDEDSLVPAYNGAWTWRLTAKPSNGVGPDLDVTGSFRVQRAAVPHDFDDNGLPDVLSLNADGLFVRSTVLGAASIWEARSMSNTILGTGWNVYDRIVPTGNLGGAAHADILTRDRTGVLWLHQGNGKKLDHRVKVGGGWNTYDQLTSAADLTGDGRTDLLATDKTGVLWLYTGTGNATSPFAARTRLGGGWNTYDKIAAVGNLAGAPAGDLVARDRAGDLWLYLGKGDGTFAARTRIGGGWQGFTQIIGVGDQDRDGRGDLMAVGKDARPALYRGTGDWKKPLAARNDMLDYHLPQGTHY
ncbi:VCBS repeat-containing protein [Streptomyces sp. NPDC013489]|uniref:VCBS repeat-containing protein n=1 Tax=Streptomyces sp. NPDC013489 TaxID=3155606 RepID=UPI0033C3808F